MKGNYMTKGVKSGSHAGKCSSGTSNTKKGTYASSEGPMKGYGNGFRNNAGGRRS
jgi:hypothetical protein